MVNMKKMSDYLAAFLGENGGPATLGEILP